LVVVRGSDAAEYVNSIGYRNSLEIITGSVLTDIRYISAVRDIDVIFVGRLVEYKRPDIFLSVIAKVAKVFPKIVVKMAGDGPMMTDLKNIIFRMGLSENVEMLGMRKDTPELLGRSKVLVLTSRWEGVSIAMLEGMALGVVPVVVNTGDLKDFVQNEQTGFITDEPDIEALSMNIQKVLSDDAIRTRLSKNARKIVMEKCDRNVLSKRWKGIIESSVKVIDEL
jgi:glycosyltransferase involved in cell wall biosynthesis